MWLAVIGNNVAAVGGVIASLQTALLPVGGSRACEC